MATFGITDVWEIMNDLYRITTHQDAIKVIDGASFIDAGNATLATGYHNILDGLSVLVGETFYNERKAMGKWRIAVRDMAGFAERKRKISFYSENCEPASFVNTDLGTSFYDGAGADAYLGNQWDDMKIPKMVEEYFYSSNVWDDHITIFEAQLQDAFRSEEEFLKFINSYMIVFTNAMDLRAQGKVQSVILDRIAGNFLLRNVRPESAVNITKVFNEWADAAYSTQELIHGDHLLDLLKTFGAKLRVDSSKMENYDTLFHDPLTKTIDGKTYNVLRTTPKSKQRFLFYKPIFDLAKEWNFSTLFNPQFIPDIQGEGIDGWMDNGTDIYGDPMKVMWKPALPNGAKSSEVNIPIVLGLLFDEDAIAVRNTFERAATSSLESRKLYYQTWYHFRFGAYQDYTEKSIMYYMADESESFTGDGTTTEFTLEGDAKRIVSITVGGTEVDADDFEFADGVVTFTTAPEAAAAIVINYV